MDVAVVVAKLDRPFPALDLDAAVIAHELQVHVARGVDAVGVLDFVLGEEAGERGKSGDRDDAHGEDGVGLPDRAAQPAHPLDVLLVAHREDDGAGGEEEQRAIFLARAAPRSNRHRGAPDPSEGGAHEEPAGGQRRQQRARAEDAEVSQHQQR